MAGLGSVTLSLSVNTKDFRTKLQQAEKSFKRFGGKLQSVGSSMTRNITMPLTLIGGASVKMATEFDTSLRKINTLVGVSKDEIAGFKDEILDLSGETAQSPAELADGLFFLTSAGLEGANAMETLTAVAKANSAGLGDQTALSKLAAAAQNAYGVETLTAADSLDIFGKMVKTGMFESNELADGLGGLMGLSSGLSVSMEELGAFISTNTKLTGDATSAQTAANGVMMSFAKITPKAEKALQGTLLHLEKSFKDQGVPMTDFFSNANAVKGVMNVLGNQTDTYVDILDDMQDTQGFVNDAFDETAKGPGFKFKQLMAELQVIGIQLGDALLPIVLKMVDKFKILAEKFTELSPKTKDIIVKIGLMAAAAGPALVAFGKIVTILPTIAKAMAALTGPVGLIVGALAIAAVMIVKNWDKIKNYFTSGAGSKMFDTIKEIVVKTMEVVAKVVAAAGKFISAVWAKIGPFVMNIVAKVFNRVGKIIQNALNLILKILNFFIDIFTGNWDGIWNSIKSTFRKLWDGVVNFFLSGIMKILRGISDFAADLGAKEIAKKIDNIRTKVGDYKDSLGHIPNINSKVGASAAELNEKFKEETFTLVDLQDETINLKEETKELNTTIEENTDVVDDNVDANKKAAAAFEKNMLLVDQNKIAMEGMDKEYDVNAEKQKLIQAEVQRLTVIYGANSKEVKALINRYKEFEVQGTSAFDIINNKAQVFGQMGKEFDSVKEKMSVLENQITSMIDSGIDPADANLQKLIETYKKLQKQGGSTTDKLAEGLEKFANVAGQIMGEVGAIFAQHHEMKMQTLENEKAAQEEDLIDDFETQKEDIENSIMTQQEKDLALEELEKSHNDKMEGISETYEGKMNAERKKQAQKEKTMAIAQAIINTAQGVSAALKSGGLGLGMAIAIGAMGLIQIGLIQSTPIPAMAEGGIVTGPTTALIGEAGAEAVIPLDKMGGMMGSQTVNVVGKISGNDIVLVSDRAIQNRTRIRGINS